MFIPTGDVIKRGCVASLNEDEFRECQAGSTCKICQGNSCNIKPSFQKCFSCNSQDDPNCATLKSALPEKVCGDYLDTCKVYVKPNSTTNRGCFKEMEGDGIECLPQSVNCKQCSDNFCNGDIFPASRVTCYHCDSDNATDDCYGNLNENLALSFPCETFNFRDSCYYFLEGSVIHRGCMSDLNGIPQQCQDDPEKCRMCQTSNCNAEAVMRNPEMSCIACDSKSEPECIWGYKSTQAESCRKQRFYYQNESCYILDISFAETIRGCTLDGNVCSVFDHCEYCKDENACNRRNIAPQFCYECTSDEDQKCGAEPFHTTNVSCSGIVEFEYRGCYTWVDDENKVKRGCYSDFNADDRTLCLAHAGNCTICVDESNCNKDAKGGTAGVIIGVFTLLLSFFAREVLWKIRYLNLIKFCNENFSIISIIGISSLEIQSDFRSRFEHT